MLTFVILLVVNVFGLFRLVILLVVNVLRRPKKASYDKLINEQLIKLTRLIETAPYDKLWISVTCEVLLASHCDIIFVLIKDTTLQEKAP